MSLQGAVRSAAVVLCLGLALALGCSGKQMGELRPPEGAKAWDSKHGQLFDDGFTPAPVELAGRAPGDVVDQQRFIQRLGHANLVVLVTLDQVWSRTLYGGVPQQRAEITLDRVLHGKMPRKVAKEQTLILRAAEEVPGETVGRVMLLFVRWAPGDTPAFHYHLTPADDAGIALIEAMVRHARAAGKIETEKKTWRQRRKKESEEPS